MRVKTADAAKQLGIPEQSLRLWIANGTCPFGYIIRQKNKRNGRNSYYICEEQLRNFIEGRV